MSNFQLSCPNCPRISNETKEENSILTFPNPVNELLHIKNGNEVIKEISIFSLMGALIENRKVNDAEDVNVNVSGYSQGAYLLQVVYTNGSKIYSKFIVQWNWNWQFYLC